MGEKVQHLRAQLEMAELEEALIKAKLPRKRCHECGRYRGATPKQEEKIRKIKAELREKRRRVREAREKTGAVT